jgi:hypothetical protein
LLFYRVIVSVKSQEALRGLSPSPGLIGFTKDRAETKA